MRRGSLSSWLGALVSVVSLAAVAWWIAHQEAPRLPSSGTGFAWLGLSLAMSLGALALRGLRWHGVMRLAGVDHRTADAYALTAVSYMGNNVLPARGGEILKIAILGSRSSSRRREILGSVLAERLLDAAVLAGAFAVLTVAGVGDSPAGRAVAAVILGAIVLAGVALGIYVQLRKTGRFERFATLVRPFARASKLFAHPAGIPLAGLSLVIWLLEGLNLVVIARSVDVSINAIDGILVVLLASLLAAVPAAPGFAGTFDAGIILGLRAAHITGGPAVSVLLLARFMYFVPATVVGLIALVARYGGLRLRERRAAYEAGAAS
jgi:glycosyltransferase 2 family protein